MDIFRAIQIVAIHADRLLPDIMLPPQHECSDERSVRPVLAPTLTLIPFMSQ